MGKALRKSVGKLNSNFLFNILLSRNTEHVFQIKRKSPIIWYMDARCHCCMPLLRTSGQIFPAGKLICLYPTGVGQALKNPDAAHILNSHPE